MLKGIIFLFFVIVSFVFFFIFSLISGINLNNLSYDNMSISKLYMKYNKKFILNVDNIRIGEDKYSFDVNIQKSDNVFRIDIKNFYFENEELSFKGTIFTTLIELKEYISGKKDSLILENVEFFFDKKLFPVLAKKVILKWKDDDLFIDVEKPTYSTVKLDNSKVSLQKDIEKGYSLYIDLYSSGLLDKNIIELVGYYGVNIPITQKSGDTKTHVRIIIPFEDESEIDVYARVNVEHGKLYFEGIELNPISLSVVVENEIVYIDSAETNLKLIEKNFKLKKLQMQIKDDMIHSSADVFDEDNNSFTLYDKINLQSLESQGKLYINSFEYENLIKLSNEKLDYTIKYEPYLKINVFGEGKLLVKGHLFNIDKFILDVYRNKIGITTNIKDNLGNSFTIYNNTQLDKKLSNGDIYINQFLYEDLLLVDTQRLAYSFEHESFAINLKGSLDTFIKGKKTLLDDLNLTLKDNFVDFMSRFTYKEYIFTLKSLTDFQLKKSKGDILIDRIRFKNYIDLKDESFQYKLNFNDTMILEIPKFGLQYAKFNTQQTILIDNINGLLNSIDNGYLNSKNKKNNAKVKIDTNDSFKSTNIIIDNLHIGLKNNIFNEKVDKKNMDNFPDINLSINDSSIEYNTTHLAFEKIDFKTFSNKILVDLRPKGEKSVIKFFMVDKDYRIFSNGLSDKFINKVLKKKWFQDGSFNITIYGDFEKLNGKLEMVKTNVRNMYILNNLITFVNTTPAIINPILALPTIFRLGETDFNLDGYYVKQGNVNFDYDINTKYLTINELYTNSKMTDFKVDGGIDLLNEELKLKFNVIFLKDFSKFINHIPLVGYIITGENGNFITQIDVKGDFNKQSFETHTIKDATDGVLGVIKRTLSIPLAPFVSIGLGQNDSNNSKEVLLDEVDRDLEE